MRPKKKMYFMECHVAGRQYHEASEVWDKLAVGTQLRLEREPANRFDPNAIAIMYDDKDMDEEFCLGYIPRSDNEDLAKFLEMGWGDIFEVRISQKNGDVHYEQQLHVVIKIHNREFMPSKP